jgi:hypothetical protein
VPPLGLACSLTIVPCADGVTGLSQGPKMTKSQLLDLAGNGARRRPMIELEPLPESSPSSALYPAPALVYNVPRRACASASSRLSFANRERRAAQSPEHEGRSREAGFFTHVGRLPFLLTGWPHDPV